MEDMAKFTNAAQKTTTSWSTLSSTRLIFCNCRKESDHILSLFCGAEKYLFRACILLLDEMSSQV